MAVTGLRSGTGNATTKREATGSTLIAQVVPPQSRQSYWPMGRFSIGRFLRIRFLFDGYPDRPATPTWSKSSILMPTHRLTSSVRTQLTSLAGIITPHHRITPSLQAVGLLVASMFSRLVFEEMLLVVLVGPSSMCTGIAPI